MHTNVSLNLPSAAAAALKLQHSRIVVRRPSAAGLSAIEPTAACPVPAAAGQAVAHRVRLPGGWRRAESAQPQRQAPAAAVTAVRRAVTCVMLGAVTVPGAAPARSTHNTRS